MFKCVQLSERQEYVCQLRTALHYLIAYRRTISEGLIQEAILLICSFSLAAAAALGAKRSQRASGRRVGALSSYSTSTITTLESSHVCSSTSADGGAPASVTGHPVNSNCSAIPCTQQCWLSCYCERSDRRVHHCSGWT